MKSMPMSTRKSERRILFALCRLNIAYRHSTSVSLFHDDTFCKSVLPSLRLVRLCSSMPCCAMREDFFFGITTYLR
jgi:hypothetical protein